MRLLSICLIALFGLLTASSVIYGRSELEKRAIGQYVERDLEVSSLEKRKGGGGGGKGGSSGSKSDRSHSNYLHDNIISYQSSIMADGFIYRQRQQQR